MEDTLVNKPNNQVTENKNPPLRNGINPEKMLEDHLPTEIEELEDQCEEIVKDLMEKSSRLMKLQVLDMIVNYKNE